jgi:choline transport protein
VAWATVMSVVVLILTWACAIGITTTASRMIWAFARDMGFPFSRFLKKVDHRTKVPIVAVGAVVVLACLLTLIYIGSPTAFNDVISLTITGFYGSYLLPASLLLYRRIKGDILPYGSVLEGLTESLPGNCMITDTTTVLGASDVLAERSAEKYKTGTKSDRDETDKIDASNPSPGSPLQVTFAPAKLVWGPWHISGIFGIINNAYACIYMIFVLFWSVWPPETPVSYTTMNYSIVVTAGVIIFSVVWYFVRARHEYKGPLLDQEVAELMRLGPTTV